MRNSKVTSLSFHSLKAFIFIMILLQGLSMVQNQSMNAGQVKNISGDVGQFSTLSEATANSGSGGIGTAQSLALGSNSVSRAVTTGGDSKAIATGANSLANAESDEGKVSKADATTDSKGGSAAASALNNSNSKAISLNSGNSIAVSDKNAKANSVANGNADSVSLATDNGVANSNAHSTTFTLGINDQTSSVDLNADSKAGALAAASGTGIANADSYSTAGSIATAIDNSKASATSKSNSDSVATASDGVSNSIADSRSLANSGALGGGQIDVASESNVNSKSSAGDQNYKIPDIVNATPAIRDVIYLGNPISSNKDNTNPNGPLMGDTSKGDALIIQNADVKLDANQIQTNAFKNWESVYKNVDTDRYHHKKFVSLVSVNYEDNIYLPELNLPQVQIKSASQNLSSNINVKWTYTEMVAVDIGMDSQGYTYAAGLDGYLYEYNMRSNSWEKVEGDFDLDKILRVDVGLDATPYVITASGDTYYLNCEHKWEKLPGCARDIGAGRGGDVFKIGCERRNEGFRIYKLICKYECSCKSFLRYRKKCETCYTYEKDTRRCKWFNLDGAGVRIDVHPNGNPVIIDDTGLIQFYNGVDWVGIPDTNALDVSVSNEGVIFYVGNDYSVYRLITSKYENDYTKVQVAQLLNLQAIAVSVGPYSQPIIISDGYKVYSSSKLGYN